MTAGKGCAGRVGPVLVPYDPIWPHRFEEAARAISSACGKRIVAVEHIGSTAVPGLAAKPVLDVMPGLRADEDGGRMVEPMAALGYEYRGEFGIPGRHYFTRPIEDDSHVVKHHVHAYPIGHPEWVRHLAFRDALRRDPLVATEYAQLKHALAARHHDDVEAYAAAKTAFIDRIVAELGGPPRRVRDTVQ